MSQGVNIHFDKLLLPEFSVKLQYFPDIADLRRKTAGTFPQFSKKLRNFSRNPAETRYCCRAWLVASQILGVTPLIFLKTLLNEEALEKPQAWAMSLWRAFGCSVM